MQDYIDHLKKYEESPELIIDLFNNKALAKKVIKEWSKRTASLKMSKDAIISYFSKHGVTIRKCTMTFKVYPVYFMTKLADGSVIGLDVAFNNYKLTENTWILSYAYNYDNMGLVQPYSTRAESILPFLQSSKDKGKMIKDNYYGVELEVDRRPNAPKDICFKVIKEDLKDFAILKSDSSIPSTGFEIVTAPATFLAHKERWEPFFSNSAKYLRSYIEPSCGMHIHINRKALSGLHMAKFLCFINEPENKIFVESLAGRSNSSYAKMSKKKLMDVLGKGEGKYHAVNLNPKKTIEVRIFKGTVSRRGFFKNLEFIDALVNYTRYCSAVELSYKRFIEWLRNNGSGYENLCNWLVISGFTDSMGHFKESNPDKKVVSIKGKKTVIKIDNKRDVVECA